MMSNRLPKPVWVPAGEDPVTYKPPHRRPSCLPYVFGFTLLLIGVWWMILQYQHRKLSEAQLPTVAAVNTATHTLTPSITFTPSITPTGTSTPITPTMTSTDGLETRIYGKIITGTAFTLTATFTPSDTPVPTHTFTPRPRPTRRPVSSGGGSSPGGSGPQPTPFIMPTQPIAQPPQYTPLPPGWQPSPIWNGTLPPTIDYSVPTSTPLGTLMIDIPETPWELPTREPEITMIPTETPTPTMTMTPTETATP